MIIKKATLSSNDYAEALAAFTKLGLYGEALGNATCLDAVKLNDAAAESGLIDRNQLGAVVAISPMQLGLTISVLTAAAYEAGKSDAA